MSFVKTSLLNSVSVAVKLASALFLNKLFAIYIGPAGYAVIGQFQNIVSIIVSLAGGVVATGVTKLTAEHFDDEAKQYVVWQTAIRFSIIASIFTTIVLLLIGDSIAKLILRQPDMSSVFYWLAFVLPAITVNTILLAIINGKKEIGIYVIANIIASLISASVTGVLSISFGLHGALVAFAINPAIALLATGLMIIKRNWFKKNILWGRINSLAMRELTGFGFMGLTSILTLPISLMLIRDFLTTNVGIKAAGYWQGSWKISEMYLMIITTTLSVYYLPRLAEIRKVGDLESEIVKIYRVVMPVVIFGAITIYILRDLLIVKLFTPEFLPMRELFAWQLTGDVIKIGSWVLAYIMLGRAMIKAYITTEIIFSFTLTLLSWVFIKEFGLIGAPIAYALNYLIYWMVVGYLVVEEIS